MKQTAVEWLEQQINERIVRRNPHDNIVIQTQGEILIELIEQAKEIEKERMINFAKYCLNNAKHLNFDKALFNVEEYYQIFKSE